MSNESRLIELERKYGRILSPAAFQSLLRDTRQACIDAIQPQSRAEYNTFVASCMLDQLTDREQVVFANRQYVLTLWPAFVAFICSLAADPGYMVYDNFWWALIFGLTCAGLPGLANSLPPHHLTALTTTEGRAFCEGWTYNPAEPATISRSHSRKLRPAAQASLWTEWSCFLLSLALYILFVVLFSWSLKYTFTFLIATNQWLVPATWYYVSIAPAIGAAIVDLLNDRVELFEPVGETPAPPTDKPEDRPVDVEVSPQADAEPTPVTRTSSTAPILEVWQGQQTLTRHLSLANMQRYRRSQVKSGIHLFCRMIKLQWTRGAFRILVKPRTRQGPLGLFNAIAAPLVIMGRITLFAAGSTLMGDLIFMPWPQDQLLFVLLLLTTLMPRLTWPTFWTSGVRGADLVVWAHDT